MGRVQSLLAQPSSFVPKQSKGAGSKFKLTLQGSIIRQMPAIQETETMTQCQQGTELGAGLLTALHMAGPGAGVYMVLLQECAGWGP